jgi:hypothetical protein
MCSFLDRLVRLFQRSRKPPTGKPQLDEPADYWQERKTMRYYREVIRLARKYAPAARSVLDVGPNGTPLVCELDWIPSKTVIDLASHPIPGATCIQGDFLRYQPPQPFDLVLCLQVLEHVGPAGEFAQKLLEAGRVVIVSVPYCWPAGGCKHHVHDPVDEDKLLGWMQTPFVDHRIIRDRARDRLVAVIPGKAAAAMRRAA